MKRILFTSIILLVINNTYAQEAKPSCAFKYKNSLQLSLLGHGGFYSVGYERILLNHSKFKTTAEVGVAYYPEEIIVWIPVMFNFLYSPMPGSENMEIGLGHVFIMEEYSTYSDWHKGYATFKLGYRHQKPDGRIVFRIYYSPLIEYYIDYRTSNDRLRIREFHHWGGLSVGYAF